MKLPCFTFLLFKYFDCSSATEKTLSEKKAFDGKFIKASVYDVELYKRAFELAEKNGIKCQTKTVVAGGNDAAAIHKSGKGVRTAAISVPTRYIHSQSCVAKKEDIEAVEKLAECLARELAND